MHFIKDNFTIDNKLFSLEDLKNDSRIRIRTTKNFLPFKSFELYLDDLKGLAGISVGQLVMSNEQAFFFGGLYESNMKTASLFELYNIDTLEPFFEKDSFRTSLELSSRIDFSLVSEYSSTGFRDLKIALATSLLSIDRKYLVDTLPQSILDKGFERAMKYRNTQNSFALNDNKAFISRYLYYSSSSVLRQLHISSIEDLDYLLERISYFLD